jgi:hypothetical protein
MLANDPATERHLQQVVIFYFLFFRWGCVGSAGGALWLALLGLFCFCFAPGRAGLPSSFWTEGRAFPPEFAFCRGAV